jgi:hypothetical protein
MPPAAALEACSALPWSVARQKATEIFKKHKPPPEHRFAHARPYPNAAAYPIEFFCSFLSFFNQKKKRGEPNECHRLGGTPLGTRRDSPRSRLLPRPAFSAASCPPQIFTPLYRGRRSRSAGQAGVNNDETALLCFAHRNELGQRKKAEEEHLPALIPHGCSNTNQRFPSRHSRNTNSTGYRAPTTRASPRNEIWDSKILE